MLAPLDDARNTQIELLRSDAWIAAHGARIGRTIRLEIPELSLSSAARVVSISAGPAIMPGEGRVVTGLFRHTAEQLLELHVEGLAEPIVGTPKHPYWSVTRNDFVAADQLSVSEELQTSDGRTVRVAGINFRREPTTVYNLEVHGEHVYHVSPLGLLVHNASQRSLAERLGVDSDTIRGLPGTAHGGHNLPHITGKWLDNGVGQMPGQIADLLRGKTFSNFKAFRKMFWELVAADPHLGPQFKANNRAAIRQGYAPTVPMMFKTGSGRANSTFNLDHIDALEEQFSLLDAQRLTYDLDNIQILAPYWNQRR